VGRARRELVGKWKTMDGEQRVLVGRGVSFKIKNEKR
jgi:hypothetical protein